MYGDLGGSEVTFTVCVRVRCGSVEVWEWGLCIFWPSGT